MILKIFLALPLVSLSTPASAKVLEEKTINMSFDSCLKLIRSQSSELTIAPVNIVETNILRVVRFVLSDGSVLISCSKLDNTMKAIRTDR